MDVNAEISANNLYLQWKNSENHVAPWTADQVFEIVHTDAFQLWHSNTHGTVDQYYIYLSNRQAYQNSPQYMVDNLEAQIEEMSDEVESLNSELSEFKEEICEKEDRISYLETLSSITLTTSFISLIISCVLLYKLLKRR